jgi:hypothetical protein
MQSYAVTVRRVAGYSIAVMQHRYPAGSFSIAGAPDLFLARLSALPRLTLKSFETTSYAAFRKRGGPIIENTCKESVKGSVKKHTLPLELVLF